MGMGAEGPGEPPRALSPRLKPALELLVADDYRLGNAPSKDGDRPAALFHLFQKRRKFGASLACIDLLLPHARIVQQKWYRFQEGTGFPTASGVGVGGPPVLVLMGLLGVPGIFEIFTLERILLTMLHAPVCGASTPGPRQ